MKKAILGLAAFSAIFAASCSTNNDNAIPIDSWTVNGTRYVASAVTGNASGQVYKLIATTGSSSSNAASLTFEFSTTGAPPAGGYTVISGVTGTPNTVNVTATNLNGTSATSYRTTGLDAITATVSVVNNKLVVTLPDAYARNLGVPSDSIKISASQITEQ